MRGIAKRKKNGSRVAEAAIWCLQVRGLWGFGGIHSAFERISIEDLTWVWVWRIFRRFDRVDGALESQDLI